MAESIGLLTEAMRSDLRSLWRSQARCESDVLTVKGDNKHGGTVVHHVVNKAVAFDGGARCEREMHRFMIDALDKVHSEVRISRRRPGTIVSWMRCLQEADKLAQSCPPLSALLWHLELAAHFTQRPDADRSAKRGATEHPARYTRD
eukprot:2783670-Pleurochrysis_carterae.AAC.2